LRFVKILQYPVRHDGTEYMRLTEICNQIKAKKAAERDLPTA
jgi:hypothetical protein